MKLMLAGPVKAGFDIVEDNRIELLLVRLLRVERR